MPSYRMVASVIGAAMIMASASCTDSLTTAAEEELAGNAESTQEQLRQQASSTWPKNEPAGMMPIIFVDGSSKIFPDFGQSEMWMDDGRVAVVDDPASKHGRAVEKRFFVGDRSGWNGHTYRAFDAYDELYFRMVFRFSANWQYHPGMNKMFYWGATGRPGNAGPTQFFLGMRGGQFEFVNQSASGESNAWGNFRGNAPRISRDEYHTVEVLHVANTPGESDGSARMWIDGVEVQDFAHVGRPGRENVELENLRWVDYGDTRLTGVVAFMFWGGQRDIKRVNDWLRISEFYVSGKNTDGGSNAGGVDNGGDGEDVAGAGEGTDGHDLSGSWSFSATGKHSASGMTCDVKGTANLLQENTTLDGSIVGTTTCSRPGRRSVEWEFEDSVAGNVNGDDIAFELIRSNGQANGTVGTTSMSGPVTWKIDTRSSQPDIVLTGNWSAVRQ